MQFLWQQRVLLLISALLSLAVASSFVLPSTAMKATAFKKARYNPLLLVSAGGDDSAAAGGSQEGDVSPEPVAADTAPIAPTPTAAAADTTAADTPASTTASTTAPVSLLGPNAKSPPGFLRATFPGFAWHRLPDLVTYARCIAIPVFVAMFYADMKGKSHLYTGTIFALASITDWLDGFLARRWDISTAFGAFLDPVADKLMVSTSLVLLSGRYGAIAAIPTLIILARELSVSALREWMAQRGERDSVKVGYQGKVKTALTMVALTILLYVPASAPTSALLYKVGIPMLYMSALITITSGSVYFIAAAPALLNTKK